MTTSQHNYFMRQCIALALIAKQRGDSGVGSVIVRNNEIIARGIEGGKTFNDITHHAEIEAVREARKILQTHDLSDCILYTTHEPCIMCSYVLRHARVRTIVFSVSSGAIGGFSSQYAILRDSSIAAWGNPPEIIQGILEDECSKLKE